MTHRRRTAATVVLTALVAFAAACSGGGSSGAADQSSGGTAFSDGAKGPAVGEHKHVAYAISICGDEHDPLNDTSSDKLGIHTHGDGLIHVHPFADTAASRKATVKAFLDDVGAKVKGATLALPDHTYDAQSDTCDGKPVTLDAAVWDDAADADAGKAPDLVAHGDDINRIVLAPGRAITIAFHAEGSTIDGPDHAVDRLARLSDAPTTTAPPTTTPGGYGTTPCPAADGSAAAVLDFPAPMAKCIDDTKSYAATFHTTEGDVVVALDTTATPVTANNFLALSLFHYYDGTSLFRTDPSIGIIQGGSPHTSSASDPGPGYALPDEGFDYAAIGGKGGPYRYQPGDLVMARRAAPNGAAAQFFFAVDDKTSLLDDQGVYVVFGHTTAGLDVLQTILSHHQPDSSGLGGAPNPPVTVTGVSIAAA